MTQAEPLRALSPLLFPAPSTAELPGEQIWPEAPTLPHPVSTLPALLGHWHLLKYSLMGEMPDTKGQSWAQPYTPDRALSLPCQMQPQSVGECPSPPPTSAFAQRSGCPSSAPILAVTAWLARPSEDCGDLS